MQLALGFTVPSESSANRALSENATGIQSLTERRLFNSAFISDPGEAV